MEIFNNREIALAIWLSIGMVLASSRRSIREAFHGIWKAFFRRPILISLGLMVSYIALVVFGLHETGLWNLGLLKNTVLWSISVATVSLFRIPQIAEDERYFRRVIKDNFKVIAVFEFVVAFYTLPLWAELLIVPLATVLVTMQVYAGGKEEYAPVGKLVSSLLGLFGWGLIVYATYKLVTDFGTFAQLGTLTNFSLPIVLSLLFLPFLFVLALYINYEEAFLRLNFTIKDVTHRRYAKRVALVGFHVRTGLLKRWLSNIGNRVPANKQELKASVAKVKDLAARERHPEIVPPAQGWSPYRAREYLTSEGLIPGDYHQDPLKDTLWFASSTLEIGSTPLPNNIAYYIEGNEFIAQRLKLVANLNNPETASKTCQRFVEIAGLLFHRALHQEMPDDLQESITAETPSSYMIAGKTVEFVREAWPSARGYSLRFTIDRAIPAS